MEELTDMFYNIYKTAGLAFVSYIFCILHKPPEVNTCHAFMK